MSNGYESHDKPHDQLDDSSLATQCFTQEEDYYSSTDELLATLVLPDVEVPSTSVKPTNSILRKKKFSPLELAVQFLSRFVATLLWDTQSSAYREFGEKFLRMYSQWYNESQSIKNAEALGAYKPSACRVNSAFLQPCERVREGTAYKSLLAKSNAKCEKWSLARGSFHLEVRRMNNEAKREEILELMAFSIYRMASILLSTIEGIAYGPHNLVADMLLLGHDAVLKEVCGLEEFITSYKRKHKINHNVKDPHIMYARLFGSATEHDGGTTVQENTPKSPILKDATRDINEIPPTTAGKADSAFPAINLFADNPPTATASSLETMHKAFREQFAMLIAMTSDSVTMQKMIESNAKLADMGKLGKSLVEKEGGITSNIASKLTNDAIKQPATPNTTKTTPTKKLPSPKLIYDHYSKKYRFTREETAEDVAKWLETLDETMRQQLCQNQCLINSIRDATFKLPDELPPAPTTTGAANITAPADEEPPRFKNGTSEKVKAPPSELNSVPVDKIGKLAQVFHAQSERIFAHCISIFHKQSKNNKTIENINATENALKKSESASKSAVVTWTEQQKKASEGKAVGEIATEQAKKASRETVRKTNNSVEALKQKVSTLSAKLKQQERELAKRQREEESDDAAAAKAPGGHLNGALQRNQEVIELDNDTPQTQSEPVHNLYNGVSKKKARKKQKTNANANANREKTKSRETPHGGNQRGNFSHRREPNIQESVGGVQREQGGHGRGRGRGNFNAKLPPKGRQSGRGRGRGNP